MGLVKKFEYVYLGRDNSIDLVLLADGDAPDLSAVTGMSLIIGDTEISSTTTSGAFDWTSEKVTAAEAAEHSGISAGDPKLIISIGNQDIDPGDYEAQLVVFDTSNPNGIVWGTINLRVED